MLTQKAYALKILICLTKLLSIEEVPIFAPILSCMGVPISLYFIIKLFYLYQSGRWKMVHNCSFKLYFSLLIWERLSIVVDWLELIHQINLIFFLGIHLDYISQPPWKCRPNE